MGSKEFSYKNMNLFDDDDGDDVLGDAEPEEFDLNLDEKLNKSDRKTSKLIELQSKFAHDSRFKIGEQFLDDDEEDEAPKTEIEAEKSKNLAILEQVLGKKIHQTKPIDPVNEYRKKTAQQFDKRHSFGKPPVVSASATTAAFSSVLTPRFDPTKEDSKVFELEDESAGKKRKVNIDFDELDRQEEQQQKTKKAKKEKPATTVEKAKASTKESSQKSQTKLAENYYEVNANLKESLAGGEDFSLGSFLGLSSFEEPSKDISAVNENATAEPISALERKKGKQLRNPFKYDSSDDEDEFMGQNKWNNGEELDDYGGYDEEVVEDEEAEDAVQLKVSPPTPQLLSAFGGFFFRPNDSRLKQDLFYSTEAVEKARKSGKERSLAMMRALSFRKRAAVKNLKSDEKFAKKQKMLRQMKRKGGKRHFSRGARFNNRKSPYGDNRRSAAGSSRGYSNASLKPVASESS